jgi:flagellar hook protein FlgE
MGLSQALFAGLSGLDVNQTMLNVAGNNIANVNTVAFKSSRAIFTPQYYQTLNSGSPPDGTFGGTDPNQEGLGAQTSSIQEDQTQGSIQATGIDTDLAINGQGYFVVQNASNGQEFTRDGSFTLNANHELVSSAGEFVQGYGVDTSGNVIQGQLQNLTIPVGSATIAKATSNVALSGNLDADGVVATGSSVLDSQDLTTSAAAGGATPTAATNLTDLVNSSTGTPAFTAGQVITLNAERNSSNLPSGSFTVTATSTLADLQTFFNNNLGIDTSVAGAGTQLINGTAANSVDLQIVGNTGKANALTIGAGQFADAAGNTPLSFTNDASNDPTGESTTTAVTVYDSLGSPVTVNVTSVLETKSDAGTSWKFYATTGGNDDPANPGSTLVGTGTLSFNGAGQLISSSGTQISIHRSGTGATPVLPVTLSFTGVSALAEDAAHTGSDVTATGQDGIQLGTLTTFSIGNNGVITGNFDNGQTRALGQVAMATFNNPDGLNNLGSNKYAEGSSSGIPVINAPARLGGGTIESGALEQSNVDLSKEFANLIVASTGFSAADRVISTSNQLLTDLLNSQH